MQERWIDVTARSSPYEVQFNTMTGLYRHRLKCHTVPDGSHARHTAAWKHGEPPVLRREDAGGAG